MVLNCIGFVNMDSLCYGAAFITEHAATLGFLRLFPLTQYLCCMYLCREMFTPTSEETQKCMKACSTQHPSEGNYGTIQCHQFISLSEQQLYLVIHDCQAQAHPGVQICTSNSFWISPAELPTGSRLPVFLQSSCSFYLSRWELQSPSEPSNHHQWLFSPHLHPSASSPRFTDTY